MSRTIQLRRGTAAEHENFIGKVGEVTMDTTNKTLRVHDGKTVGGTPLAKQQELFNGLNNKLNIDLDNMSNTAKATLVSLCMPDYINQIWSDDYNPSGTKITCVKDSLVIVWGKDQYEEDFYAYTYSPTDLGPFIVGYRGDDVNRNTQWTSFSFFVPAGWKFTCTAENGFKYRIYPLKGA
jgi:hypothetical protein